MEKFKTQILTTQEFFDNRPDLAIHTYEAVQSAIYQSASLLNGECNGLIEEVWNYMNSGETIDKNNTLYRTSSELGFLKDALIMQTQFTINNGNDFVQGSANYNASGFNYSESTPVERDVLAPSVIKLLAKARLYNFVYVGGDSNKKTDDCVFDPDTTPITISQADLRYVPLQPREASPGQILVINPTNTTNRVIYQNPQDIINNLSLKATTVKDKDNDFRELKNTQVVSDLATGIQNVLDISNSKDNEINEKINEINAKLEDGIIFKNRGAYQSGQTYKLLDVVTYNNKVYFCKVETTTNPPTNKTDWGVLTPEVIDLSPYATREWVNQQLEAYDTREVANTKYVNLTQEQNITGKKNFVNDFLTQKLVGNGGWYELRRSDNTRLGLIGKTSSANNKFTVWSDLENIVLKAPTGKNIEIDVQNNVHSEKTPTYEFHLTNKRYVDSRDNALSTRITNLENNVVTVSNWSDSVTYRLGQQVYFNNEFYISTQDNNTNHQPDTSPDFWKLLTAQGGTGGTVDLSGYYTKPEADAKFATNTQLQDYLTIANAENTYVKTVDISNFATQEWVTNQNYATQSELNSYVLTSTLTSNYRDNNWIDSNVVKFNTNQTITGRKIFHNEFLTHKFVGATGWTEWRRADNNRTGLIGKVSASHNKFAVWSDEDNLLLIAPENRFVEIDARNNVYSSKAPTAAQHLTNKAYVDNTISPVSTKANANETNINSLTTRVTTLENSANSGTTLSKKVIDFSANDNWSSKSWNDNRTTLTAKINLLNFLNQTQIDNLVNVLFKSTSVPSGVKAKDIAISHYIEGSELIFKLQTPTAASGTNAVFRGVITLIFANQITTV